MIAVKTEKGTRAIFSPGDYSVVDAHNQNNSGEYCYSRRQEHGKGPESDSPWARIKYVGRVARAGYDAFIDGLGTAVDRTVDALVIAPNPYPAQREQFDAAMGTVGRPGDPARASEIVERSRAAMGAHRAAGELALSA